MLIHTNNFKFKVLRGIVDSIFSAQQLCLNLPAQRQAAKDEVTFRLLYDQQINVEGSSVRDYYYA